MGRTNPGHRGLILIVDDDEDSRYMHGMILEGYGYDVVRASSGREALRIARERHPGAILMAASIPPMDGWTVAERLKEDPATAPIPVIIISAHELPEERARAERVVYDGLLTGPCEPGIVLDEVSRLMGDEASP